MALQFLKAAKFLTALGPALEAGCYQKPYFLYLLREILVDPLVGVEASTQKKIHVITLGMTASGNIVIQRTHGKVIIHI